MSISKERIIKECQELILKYTREAISDPDQVKGVPDIVEQRLYYLINHGLPERKEEVAELIKLFDSADKLLPLQAIIKQQASSFSKELWRRYLTLKEEEK